MVIDRCTDAAHSQQSILIAYRDSSQTNLVNIAPDLLAAYVSEVRECTELNGEISLNELVRFRGKEEPFLLPRREVAQPCRGAMRCR